MDSATRRRIVTPADEIAARNGCYYDERAGMRVVEFFRRFLRHSKGSDFAGRPFELLDWQREEIILPLFGWKRSDGMRRFRKTYLEIPKKNGKSTLASGIGLYLLVGDNEPGAEVYSAATDQTQASIVHGEAINMVDASPELSSILQVNRSNRNIIFPGCKSYYRALSSDAAGKEGLNAHAVIADELHVWKGRKLWAALRYAFRARKQGLLFVITTAGDDPTSVCFEQHLYARDVLSGVNTDERFFAYIRAANESLGDNWTDPAVWHKANPGLGTVIDPIEFAHDVEEAKKSPLSQSEFKRYSLNIWASAQQPWLRMEDWNACQQAYTLESLAGRECYGGLDLAKTRDMTALVLVFPELDGTYKLWPFFWLPEDTVHDPDMPEHYRLWQREGWIETTPGNVCDYGFIEKRILEISQQFDLRKYAFDPYNAEATTQRLEDQHDIKRIAFQQTIKNFAEPTSEFERLVLSQKLVHNGHPILAWQAGNVNVRTDANNNRRPVKPQRGDTRTIDGIVAAIMGLAQALQSSNEVIRESVLVY